jgi:GNAT superfamily N-acetyltransferase
MSEEVRIATREDEHEIIQLLHVMHFDNGMMPLDEQCASEFFSRAFNKTGGIIGVIGQHGDIRAMIYLLLTRFWYTSTMHMEECFNFVRPDMRKSDYARTLINFAQKCADEIKIPLIIGVLTNNRMEGKVRLYRRALGIPSGAFFVYGANWSVCDPSSEDFWRSPFPERKKTQTLGQVRAREKLKNSAVGG